MEIAQIERQKRADLIRMKKANQRLRNADNTISCLKSRHILVSLGLYNEQDLSRPPHGHSAVEFVLKNKGIKDCLTNKVLKLSDFRFKGQDVEEGSALTLKQIYEQTMDENGQGAIPTYLVAFIEAVR